MPPTKVRTQRLPEPERRPQTDGEWIDWSGDRFAEAVENYTDRGDVHGCGKLAFHYAGDRILTSNSGTPDDRYEKSFQYAAAAYRQLHEAKDFLDELLIWLGVDPDRLDVLAYRPDDPRHPDYVPAVEADDDVPDLSREPLRPSSQARLL